MRKRNVEHDWEQEICSHPLLRAWTRRETMQAAFRGSPLILSPVRSFGCWHRAAYAAYKESLAGRMPCRRSCAALFFQYIQRFRAIRPREQGLARNAAIWMNDRF